MTELAPVVLFVYNRPSHTEDTINALKSNFIASNSDLIIYSDEAKTDSDKDKVNEVRKVISNVDGFNRVKVIYHSENQGLAKSITRGVSEVIEQYGKVIVLEDDIKTSPYFLTFMNEALDHYIDEQRVWHISGWNYNIDSDGLDETFFWTVMNCWGWATWKSRWQYFEKNPNKLLSSWSQQKIKEFNVGNKFNFWQQVIANDKGDINTWAIFWYATIFDNQGLCLNPTSSLVSNTGLDGSGENCGVDYKYKSSLTNIKPRLPKKIEVNGKAVQRIIEFWIKNKPSFSKRVLKKIKSWCSI